MSLGAHRRVLSCDWSAIGRHLDQIWCGGYDALFANALAHAPISFSIRGILIEADSLESV